MNHNNKKFVKIMSVFLGIVLFLTFFSKTIYQFNLPTVTAVLPGGGKLVDVIKENTLITYADSNYIYAESGGKIKNVFVAVGQEIKKGQALIEIELNEKYVAELQLDIQKKEQDIELLSLKLNNLQSDNFSEQIDYEKQKSNDLVQKTENKVLKIMNDIEGLEIEISNIENGQYNSLKQSEYESNIKIAEDAFQVMQILYDAGAESFSSLNESRNTLDKAMLQYEQFTESEIKSRREEIKAKNEQLDILNDSKQEQIETLNNKLFSFEQEQKKDNENSVYLLSDLSFQMNNALSELALLKAQLERTMNGTIVSETNGIIIGVEVSKGKFIGTNDVITQISESSDVFKAELLVDEEKLDLITSESDIEINIRGIGEVLVGEVISAEPYKEDETKYLITIMVKDSDSRIANKNASITIKTESPMYSVIVPNSAIRQDSKGYYVLALREEENILGKNFVAHRVDIALLDSDESLSAIDGLFYIEPIIVTSTSPIDAGSRVTYEE